MKELLLVSLLLLCISGCGQDVPCDEYSDGDIVRLLQSGERGKVVVACRKNRGHWASSCMFDVKLISSGRVVRVDRRQLDSWEKK